MAWTFMDQWTGKKFQDNYDNGVYYEKIERI